MSKKLYDDIVEYVHKGTSFYEKETPDLDLETQCFVSHERQCVLKVQLDELGEVSLEYGKDLQDCETKSGFRYMRTLESKGATTVESLEDAAEFLIGNYAVDKFAK